MIGKNRNRRLFLTEALITITLILVLMTGSIQAFGPGSRDHSGYGRGNNKPTENKLLNLSPEQESQLKGLRDKFLEETVFIRSDIPKKLFELRTLWTEPKPDVDKINTKKREIMEVFTQLQIKATAIRSEAQSFLTPEQADKLPVFGLHLEIEPNWALGPRFSS